MLTRSGFVSTVGSRRQTMIRVPFAVALLAVSVASGCESGLTRGTGEVQPSKPMSARPGDEIVNSIDIKLRFIPAGEFLMGSSEEEKGRNKDEKQHHVGITKPFFMGQYEVTRRQFGRFVDETGFKTEAEKDGKGGYGYTGEELLPFDYKPEITWFNPGFEQTGNHPVVNVSWNDAMEFCEWLSRKEGKEYRLPTEAEWEYACRGGTKTPYQGGDDAETLADFGNVADKTAKLKFGDLKAIRAQDGYVFTAPIGQFRANQFGLHDMHGNVWEWCSDLYAMNYYSNSPAHNPKGSEEGFSRVSRGGSWMHGASDCRSALRSPTSPSFRSSLMGFRIACSHSGQ